MVDSLPPSGTDPDNETIMTNSNDKLEVIESTAYLGDFDQDSGDWTGITRVVGSSSPGDTSYAKVIVREENPLPRSASVTADLTAIDVLNFRIRVNDLKVKIKVDGIELVTLDRSDGWQTVEISGLDDYDFGTNSTLTIEVYYRYDEDAAFYIDYVHSEPIQPESRIIELVDTGGL